MRGGNPSHLLSSDHVGTLGSSPIGTICKGTRPSKFLLGGSIDVTCIVFKLRIDVPANAQEELLESIAGWDDQNRAGRLHVGAIDPEKQALCYVYVADDNNVRMILKRLQETQEVEYARVPAQRYVAEVRTR
jgi:hypothetical protein